MKPSMVTGGLLFAAIAVNSGEGLYWVVGNRATQRCDIVTSNPVVYAYPAYNGGYWFGDGPYRSRDDARLARSTILSCPREVTDER